MNINLKILLKQGLLLFFIIFAYVSYSQVVGYNVSFGKVMPSLITIDHTAEGLLESVNDSTIIHIFRLDSGYEAHHIGNASKIVKRYTYNGGESWTEPELVYNSEWDDRNIHGGMVGNRLVMSFRRYNALNDSTIDMNIMYSDDGGQTWSDRIIVTTNGLSSGTHKIINVPGKGNMLIYCKSYYLELRYSQDGANWDSLGYVWDYTSHHEYMIAEASFAYMGKSNIVGLIRNNVGTYGANYYQVMSKDTGVTWSNPVSTNIADSFFCPSPLTFYDSISNDIWSIAPDRRGNLSNPALNNNSEIWVYRNKPEDIIDHPRNYTLAKKFSRPFPSDYRLYGYPIVARKHDGGYLVIFSESYRKPNWREDADFYQFSIDYEPVYELSAQIEDIHAKVCDDNCNGHVRINPVNGLAPFTIIWPDGYLGDERNDLCIGAYDVTINDNFGQSYVVNVEISHSDTIKFASDVINRTCFNNANGEIRLSEIDETTSNYTYLWSNGETTSYLLNLPDGSYDVTITDFYGCNFDTTFSIVDVSDTIAVKRTIKDIGCFGQNNGECKLDVDGGISPFSFLWSTGDSISLLENLAPGLYYYTITDIDGCQVSDSIIITEPEKIVDNVNLISPSCYGSSDGVIELFPSGGTGNLFVMWPDSILTNSLHYLTEGHYQVTVIDELQCSEGFSYNLTSPDSLTLTSVIVSQTTSDGGIIDLMVSGGTAPYLYLWSDNTTNEDISGLARGEYSVTVSDANLCESFQVFSVDAVCELTAEILTIPTACYNSQNGSANIIVSKAYNSYDISCSNGQSGSYIDELSAGIYAVTITDEYNCEFVSGFVISQPDSVSATIAYTSPSGENEFDGSLFVLPYGGTPPFTVSWNNGAVTDSLTGLDAGIYYYNIVDFNGCSKTDSIELYYVTNDIRKFDDVTITVFPNPSNGKISINTGKPYDRDMVLTICDELGKLVYSSVLSKNLSNYTFDFGYLPKGIYSLQLYSNQMLYSKTIIIN